MPSRRRRRNVKSSVSPPAPLTSDYIPAPFTHFSKFVDDQKCRHIGCDLSENGLPFVPHQALVSYWTKARIHKILSSFPQNALSANIDLIQGHYIRTFSTLVYCAKVAFLEQFIRHKLDDDRLPLTKAPSEWPNDPHFQDLFSSFVDHQWLFFPLVFTPNELEDRHLDKHQVLPIKFIEELSHGDAAIVQKVAIDETCNNLVKDRNGRPTQNTFVLKTYIRPKFETVYENEVKALRMLKNCPSPHIITYYGSFRQNDTYNIILEYADRGNLAEFFKETPPPKGTDVIKFWKSLSKIFIGLDRVHHLMMNVDDKEVYGIHEDIKPENILLFKQSAKSTKSSYEFTPKVADFGLFSHVRESNSNSSQAMGLDNHGNQIYSSPECSHTATYQLNGPNMVSTRADIFSMGAVLSDACTWVIGGRKAQIQQLEKRREHHQGLEVFRGSGYEGCFHDGTDTLSVVNDMHAHIRRQCQSLNDKVTPQVVDLIEQHMLLSRAADRDNARHVMQRFEKILDMPSSNQLMVPLGTVQSVADSSTTTEVNGSKLKPSQTSLLLLSEKITTLQPVSRQARQHDNVNAEVQELIEKLKIDVPDRDHFVFIDDSTSMKKYSNLVKKASLALLNIAKRLDPNKLELAFASNPRQVHRTSNLKRLSRLMETHNYRRDPGMMEDCFARLVDHKLIWRLPVKILGINVNWFARKPTSIYIFTDGNWGTDEDGACGVERPLKRLIEELKSRRLDKNHVTLHFIRLGNEEFGRKHLNFLDKLGRDDNWDIVDAKDVSSSVRAVILGPISQANDDLDENG